MFEFTNKAPKPVVIWNELKKQSIPSGPLSHDYVRLMLWITLCASPDFKKSKESANNVLDGTISHDGLKKGLKQALAAMTESPPVKGNIPTTVVDWANYHRLHKNKLPGTDDGLLVPITMFREVFLNHDVEAVLGLANRIFPLNAEAEGIMKASMDVQDVSLLRYCINPTKYVGEYFKAIFTPASNGEGRPVMDKDDMIADIADILRNKLTSSPTHSLMGDKVELPKFTHITKEG